MPRGTKISIGNISKPEHRVLRLGNLHFDATDADLRAFFDGFDVIDWRRDPNVKSGKHTIAYVLMSSMQELFRAERDLDNKELLGRSVRLLRAKGGFKITKEGLLNGTELGKKAEPELEVVIETTLQQQPEPKSPLMEQTVASTTITFRDPSPAPPVQPVAKEQRPEGEDVALSQKMADGTSPTAKCSHIPPVATSMVPVTPRRRKKLNPSTDPSNRVLLINNLHPEANLVSINLFFTDYNVVDFKPRRHPRTGKPLGFGFVMLGSFEERNHAMQELQGKSLMGKTVRLEIANRGVRVNEEGFVDGEWGNILGRSIRRHEEDAEGRMPIQFKEVNWVEDDEFGPTPSKTALAKQTEEHRETRVAVPALVNPGCRRHDRSSTEVMDTASSGRSVPHADTDQDTHEIPDAFWPSNGWNGLRSSPLGQILPTWDINVAHRVLKPWNLAGNESGDRDANMVTEEDWYYFQPKEAARYKIRHLDFEWGENWCCTAGDSVK